MEKIPLSLRLKREMHRKLAFAHDIIVEEVYKKMGRAVLHGGTAIWRCYSGKRFSEDLDFYFSRDKEKIESIFSSLESKGFKILKKKISETSIYSELEFERVSVRLEATFQNIKGVIVDYEASDGNFISIYSLTPEMFVEEKIAAYLKRLKIRDLWDIFFLLRLATDLKSIHNSLGKLIKSYKPPVDEENLKSIILEGIVPASKEMFDYIQKKWEKQNT